MALHFSKRNHEISRNQIELAQYKELIQLD